MKRIILPVAALLLAACGSDVSGPASSLYGCVLAETRSLAVGEAIFFGGGAGTAPCLTAVDGPATFAYIPFFSASPPAGDETGVQLSVSVLGAGVVSGGASATLASDDAVAGPGGMLLDTRGPPGPVVDREFHDRLRQREIAELEPKIRASGTGAAARSPAVSPSAVAQAVPQPGDSLVLNGAISCTSQSDRTGRVEYVSDHAIVVADIQNPAGLTAQDYQFFALSFDTLVYPVATEHFGASSDIDGNGRTIIFFTRVVNELSPRGAAVFTAGVFWAGDLFPRVATARLEACPASNEAEMFYVVVPDPTGSMGPRIELAWLRQHGVRIIGHEYQHLLNAARRLYVNEAPRFERPWLNEGLSHITEELLFFEASGLERRSNIGIEALRDEPAGIPAFNRYMTSNWVNLTRFLERPDTASLMGGADLLGTRGATWSFLRYAADRSGMADDALFFGLLNSTMAGLANLDAVLGTRTMDWIQDWTVALYADDHVPNVAARHTWPSWNFRDIYRSQDQPFPLAPSVLAAAQTHPFTLRPGGTGYLTFGIGADGRATLHVEADGSAPPRALRGTYLRTQ